LKLKEGDMFKSFLNDEEYIVKKIVNRTVVLQTKNGKRQILTDVDNLKIKSFYMRKEDWLCHTEWDLQDGDTILTGMEEVGVGTPGGMEPPFHHGDLQPKKMRLSFSKKKLISFEKSWVRSKRDLKNWGNNFTHFVMNPSLSIEESGGWVKMFLTRDTWSGCLR
jgi:hypothetical protein